VHELGIVIEVVDRVSAACQGARVTRVVLEVGKLSAVLPDSLRFAFDLATEDTLLHGATLEILETPGLARCRSCAAEVVLEKPFGRCRCGGSDLEWLSGDELKIKNFEVA
jgi:hydrogenase nickel incorporation protein HypA/HybF